jgi:transcription termination factor NusA|tara:strand:+ start:104 stop:430 length:327 start_codon:yes stop_codon:yes gene_type:complete
MGSDADYIMDNMGGFDNGGLPNFLNGSSSAAIEKAPKSRAISGHDCSWYPLLDIRGMDTELASVLGSRGINTIKDLAKQTLNDISNIENLSDEKATELIMMAKYKIIR